MTLNESPTSWLCGIGLALIISAGCSKKASPDEGATELPSQELTVYTVNYPLAYFARRIAPESVRVVFPAPRDVDPAYWKPSAETIGEYQRADLILLNGAGYAQWTRYATLPRARTLTTADGCRDAFLPAAETVQHQHGPTGEHAHHGTAFTTWLDLRLALCQAGRIRDALVERLPKAREDIGARYEQLERELLKIDEDLDRAAEAWDDEIIFASHPVYQYLGDRYALRIESLHFEPGQALDDEDLKALDALRSIHPLKMMLWEGAPLAATSEQLADRDITAVVFDPLAQPPKDGDFLAAMERNAERLACATGAEACR